MQSEQPADELNILDVSEQQTIEFVPPTFIDSELAQSLIVRGRAERAAWIKGRRVKHALVSMTFAALFTFFLTLLHLPALPIYFCLLWGGLLAVNIFASIKVAPFLKAFKNRRYDLASRLQPEAYRWSTAFYPWTYWQQIRCSQASFQMLLLEGRLTELEALSYFYWGFNQKKEVAEDIPKKVHVANFLAVTFLSQKRYVEAEKIFESLLTHTRNKTHRLFLLNNYAYCLVCNKKNVEAEKILEEARKLVGNNYVSTSSMRLDLIDALRALNVDDFEAAETFIDRGAKLTLSLKEPLDVWAQFEWILAGVRCKQMRFEESKLHFRNAIDVVESGDNPDYLSLALYNSDYARMLTISGETELAESYFERSKQIFDFYIERESHTLDLIENRVSDPRQLEFGMGLLGIGDRIKYIDILKTE